MRIALVTEHLRLGGSTTFLLVLARELRRRGLDARIFVPGTPQTLAPSFAGAGIPVLLTDPHQLAEDRVRTCLAALAEFQPATVVASLGTLALEALRHAPAGVHRSAVLHTDVEVCYAVVAPYTAHLDAMVGVSSAIADALRRRPAWSGVRVEEIPYGIDLPDRPPRPRPREPGRLRVAYVGRLERGQKRVHLLPRVAADLRAVGVDARWTIVGDGPERIPLERDLAPFGATFTGALPPEQAQAQLEDQDVLLLVSDHEGLPLSLLEAMARGVVPVASRLASGLAQVVDASCGRLVDPADLGGYARELAALGRDPAQLGMMSAAAAQRIRAGYSAAAMADRWMALWNARPARGPAWTLPRRAGAPLGAPHPWLFSAPGRLLRRAARGLRRREAADG